MATRTFIFSVSNASGPLWFESLADNVWTAIPGVNTLEGVKATYSGYGGSFASHLAAWNGLAVDQSRGELLSVANGGHADYSGNEAYAIQIKSASPAWYRLSEPSPPSTVYAALPVSVGGTGLDTSTGNTPAQQGGRPAGWTAMYGDGRCRAMHSAGAPQYANGKVWFPTQSSVTGVGDSTAHAWSWNRSGMPTAPGQTPQAWANNAGPWTWLGPSAGGGTGYTPPYAFEFGGFLTSSIDPITGMIWYINGEGNGGWWSRYASLDTTSGVISMGTAPNAGSIGGEGTWTAIVYDPAWDGVSEATCRWRFFVVAERFMGANGRLWILNLKSANPMLTANWSSVATNSPSDLVTSMSGIPGRGAQYHAASRSILVYNPTETAIFGNRQLWKIRVPTNPDGTYAGGQWTVTQVTMGGSNPATGIASNYTGANAYSKYNLIRDMGGGRSALVYCGGTSLPVYCLKLPAGEIA